jgi:multiple sugar transport system permease protein
MTTGTANRLDRARRGVGVSGQGPGAPAPRSGRKKLSARTITLLAFALPSIVLLLLINLYPVIFAAVQSLSASNGLASPGAFVGLQNFFTVLAPTSQFWPSALFTVIFTVSGVFGSWAIGLALALLLRQRIPGNTIFKVLLLLPWIVPVVVSATSWNFLVATPQSPIPILFTALGMPNVLFLANPVLAQVTVCLFKVWISFPFMMMMMASALASVDVNVYEAAKMDGASAWQTFTQITLPIIRRSTFISWILMTIFCVNDFPTIYLLTQGGPVNATESLVVLAYRTVFADYQVGPGVAIAFIMTAVLVIISVVLYRQIRKSSVE